MILFLSDCLELNHFAMKMLLLLYLSCFIEQTENARKMRRQLQIPLKHDENELALVARYYRLAVCLKNSFTLNMEGLDDVHTFHLYFVINFSLRVGPSCEKRSTAP